MKMKIGLLAAAAVVVLAGFARAEDSDKFLVRDRKRKFANSQIAIKYQAALTRCSFARSPLPAHSVARVRAMSNLVFDFYMIEWLDDEVSIR